MALSMKKLRPHILRVHPVGWCDHPSPILVYETLINFPLQVLMPNSRPKDKEPAPLKSEPVLKPNPFVEEDSEGHAASIAYRYRKFKVSRNNSFGCD
jgi:hypothetical protein